MPTLGDVFRELNGLKNAGAVRDYALGGATAMLFYAEATRTYRGEDYRGRGVFYDFNWDMSEERRRQ